MRLTNKKALEKLKRKNKGNTSLANAIDKLILDIEENEIGRASCRERV